MCLMEDFATRPDGHAQRVVAVRQDLPEPPRFDLAVGFNYLLEPPDTDGDNKVVLPVKAVDDWAADKLRSEQAQELTINEL